MNIKPINYWTMNVMESESQSKRNFSFVLGKSEEVPKIWSASIPNQQIK